MQRHLFILLFAVCFGCFCGCSNSKPERTEDGRLIIYYWEKWAGAEGEAMQVVVDDFNASQNKIFVKMLIVSEMEQKLLLATAGGNPPDVAGLWGQSLNTYAAKGALTPLDALAREAGIQAADYIPVFWNRCTFHEILWALPSTPYTVALHWNRTMFRQAGLDPDRPPRSLAELEQMSERLTRVRLLRAGKEVTVRFCDLSKAEKSSKKFDILQLGHMPGEPGWFRDKWFFWFGGHFCKDERTIDAANENNIKTLEWCEAVTRKYGLDNLQKYSSGFGQPNSPQNAFFSKKVAMVLQGPWLSNMIEKFAPTLDWAAGAFPSVNPERWPNVTVAGTDVLVIPKGAHHPREAFEFIRYVNSQPVLEKLCKAHCKFTPLKAVSDSFVKTHPNPYIGVFIMLANSPNAGTSPKLPVWNEYRNELLIAIERVESLKATPREAMEQTNKRIQTSLNRSLRRWDKVKDTRLAEWRAYEPN